MAVLLDTSVWRTYFSGRMGARGARAVSDLLDGDESVLMHPAVLGELVLGGLSTREQKLLDQLPTAPELASRDVLEFVRARKLARKGIGWVDAQLLASALVAPATLWSFDEPLAKLARALSTAFDFRLQ
jgi:predicted nucleic acid-binding protein